MLSRTSSVTTRHYLVKVVSLQDLWLPSSLSAQSVLAWRVPEFPHQCCREFVTCLPSAFLAQLVLSARCRSRKRECEADSCPLSGGVGRGIMYEGVTFLWRGFESMSEDWQCQQYVWGANPLCLLLLDELFSIPTSLLDACGWVANSLFCKIFPLMPLSYQLKVIATSRPRLPPAHFSVCSWKLKVDFMWSLQCYEYRSAFYFHTGESTENISWH